MTGHGFKMDAKTLDTFGMMSVFLSKLLNVVGDITAGYIQDDEEKVRQAVRGRERERAAAEQRKGGGSIVSGELPVSNFSSFICALPCMGPLLLSLSHFLSCPLGVFLQTSPFQPSLGVCRRRLLHTGRQERRKQQRRALA